MKLYFELQPPNMINYITVKMPEGKQQKDVHPITVQVADLTREEAEEYAELIKQTFLAHWQRRVSDRSAEAFKS